ncbi:hypothetical protein [Candidatus Uabimicrobium amorphum]|uniref:Uncharacterized protein n=1 Tax=Uabimicrobium amorphum TaxID=2596890 RepID=A0A5S9IM73_UABAM|nr:hypothetical protein [Candidatus Uabimicrobium amorphum]BBM84468.1 hypothetical protein UABAM_02829 [Candidatus Uabimicrobium amorphum]
MIKTNQNVTFRVEEGIEVNSKTYVKTTDLLINANTVKEIDHVLFGSYAKVSIINASGSQATVVTNIHYRNSDLLHQKKHSLTKLDIHTTLIVNGGNHTSPWIDVSEYESLSGMVKTDQNGTFRIDYSDDASTVLASDTSGYTANTTPGFTAEKIGRYAQFVFENDSGADQTEFNYVLYGRI